MEADTLKSLTKEELAAFFEEKVLNQSTRAKIVSRRISQQPPSTKPDDHPENEVQLLPKVSPGNLTTFKASQQLFPCYTPSRKFYNTEAQAKM